jgi:hypothetical protein
MMCKLEIFSFQKKLILFLNRRTQILPPLNYVYYTWMDPLKVRELVISCGSKTANIALTVSHLRKYY